MLTKTQEMLFPPLAPQLPPEIIATIVDLAIESTACCMSAIYSERSRSRQSLLTTLCLVDDTFRAVSKRLLFDLVVLRSEVEAAAFLDAVNREIEAPRTRFLVLSGPHWSPISGSIARRVLQAVHGLESLTLGNVVGLETECMFSTHLGSLKMLHIEEKTSIRPESLDNVQGRQVSFTLDHLVLFTTFEAASTRLFAHLMSRVRQKLFIQSRTFGSNPLSLPKLPVSPIDLRPFRHLFVDCKLETVEEACLLLDDEAQYKLLSPALETIASSTQLQQLVTSLPTPSLFRALDGDRVHVSPPGRRQDQSRRTLVVRATSPEDYSFLTDSLYDQSSFMRTITHLDVVRPKPVDEIELLETVSAAQAMNIKVFVY
ncbi:hypothetical protein OIV83_006076 [Microbotryomycetes sp. JL201]|nr:hypothetical protein OIV83_006076 [Microbotryomycetes sp. JL201]